MNTTWQIKDKLVSKTYTQVLFRKCIKAVEIGHWLLTKISTKQMTPTLTNLFLLNHFLKQPLRFLDLTNQNKSKLEGEGKKVYKRFT